MKQQISAFVCLLLLVLAGCSTNQSVSKTQLATSSTGSCAAETTEVPSEAEVMCDSSSESESTIESDSDVKETEDATFTESETAQVEQEYVQEQAAAESTVTKSQTEAQTKQGASSTTSDSSKAGSSAATEAASSAVTSSAVTESTVESSAVSSTTSADTSSAAFDINEWITYSKEYAVSIGLTLDSEATGCWDNPIIASASSKYLQRDLCGMLNRYNRDSDITVVWIWAEQRTTDSWNIYIGYA